MNAKERARNIIMDSILPNGNRIHPSKEEEMIEHAIDHAIEHERFAIIELIEEVRRNHPNLYGGVWVGSYMGACADIIDAIQKKFAK